VGWNSGATGRDLSHAGTWSPGDGGMAAAVGWEESISQAARHSRIRRPGAEDEAFGGGGMGVEARQRSVRAFTLLQLAMAVADAEWWCRRHSAVRFLACGLRFSDSSRFFFGSRLSERLFLTPCRMEGVIVR
jgi:hypothetical protein